MKRSYVYGMAVSFGLAAIICAVIVCLRLQAEFREEGQDVVGVIGLLVPIALLASLFALTRHPVFMGLSLLLNVPFLLGVILGGAGRWFMLVPALNGIALIAMAVGFEAEEGSREYQQNASPR
ncbi:hypothetical protein [Paenibacillus xanthanilyticus]|uniref:Uncharacterized protein n=1 Tax=Paenibacillus xanthanilyticus TaxID=1783531 RepID=A0ABV8KB91_9BACL